MVKQTIDFEWAEQALQGIVGRQLSSVEFVQDYVQLKFDGPGLTAITHPVVTSSMGEFFWDEPGYRDELCGRIARIVVSAQVIPNEAVFVAFDDEAVVKISLREADYRAEEAVRLDVSPALWWVL